MKSDFCQLYLALQSSGPIGSEENTKVYLVSKSSGPIGSEESTSSWAQSCLPSAHLLEAAPFNVFSSRCSHIHLFNDMLMILFLDFSVLDLNF